MPRILPSQIVSFIDKIFPKAKEHKPFSLFKSHSIQCSAILNIIEKLPPELLVLPGDRYVDLVSAVAAIKTAIEDWKYRDYPLDKTPGLKEHNPIIIMRDILTMCPDEFPSKEAAKLIFIENDGLRKSLEIDISATNQALSNGEWKAAAVLAGSVVEALLFWSLNRYDQKCVKTAAKELVEEGIFNKNLGNILEKWSLHSFIEVAAKLKIIEDDTAQQARLAKGFRNLIHPGREVRLNQKCNRGTALLAVAAVELTIRDLSTKYS